MLRAHFEIIFLFIQGRLLILNVDRHLQNILVTDKDNSLILIDQGSSFPQGKWFKQQKDNGSSLQFDWMYYPFSKNRLPLNWKQFILSIKPEDLYKILVEEIQKDKHESLKISGESLFNSIASLIFLQEWLQSAKKDFPIIELARCFIRERISYVYSVNKSNGEVENLHEYPSRTRRFELQKLANKRDSDTFEGKFGVFTTKPAFLTVVSRAWNKFSKSVCSENGEHRHKKRTNTPTELTAGEVFAKLETITQMVKDEIDQSRPMLSTQDQARAKFSCV